MSYKRVVLPDIIQEYYEEYDQAHCFRGRWLLEDGTFCGSSWQDHRMIDGIDGIDSIYDAVGFHYCISLNFSNNELSFRVNPERVSWKQKEILKDLMSEYSEVYVSIYDVNGKHVEDFNHNDTYGDTNLLWLRLFDELAYGAENEASIHDDDFAENMFNFAESEGLYDIELVSKHGESYYVYMMDNSAFDSICDLPTDKHCLVVWEDWRSYESEFMAKDVYDFFVADEDNDYGWEKLNDEPVTNLG